jgi:2',3'-cyclic-nucleotide 2'-phosphodiesterase (5'-nucleotidase family)
VGQGCVCVTPGLGGHPLLFICANVRDEAGHLIVPPHVIREAGGRRIGIFAVIADQAYGLLPRDWHKDLNVSWSVVTTTRSSASP